MGAWPWQLLKVIWNNAVQWVITCYQYTVVTTSTSCNVQPPSQCTRRPVTLTSHSILIKELKYAFQFTGKHFIAKSCYIFQHISIRKVSNSWHNVIQYNAHNFLLIFYSEIWQEHNILKLSCDDDSESMFLSCRLSCFITASRCRRAKLADIKVTKSVEKKNKVG